MTNYHVFKNKELDQWGIKKRGAKRTSVYVKDKKKAERLAKDLCARSGGGEVRIHNLDGTISDSDTVRPGKDPCPPKDKVH